ncbi:acylamino-acid-releasing enzyme isoform X1 [Astyanax mexicanus]|uniref:acylaminoacyl-peptidase n=1 Tax=Astyanax mexicanus TaxID=7994 RepID=A0A8T2LGK9_ASTMX|nr:acylamino-acid-releasing enzyme isoform X1 [Astyanax mexicanus]
MKMMMEEGFIKDVFRRFMGYPVPLSASVINENRNAGTRNITIITEWGQCEMDRGVRLPFCQKWTLQCDQRTVKNILPLGPSFSFFRLLSSHSPSGTRRAVIREASAHGVGHQYLEVWGCRGLEKSFDLTALSKHGKVYEDAQFACLAWSPCEEKLLYVAEKKRVGSSEKASPSSANQSGELIVLEEEDKNVYMEDWGEGLVGKSVPVLCVADLSKREVNVCTGVPPHVSPGQALWAEGGRGVVFVGWWNEPFRLGLKFCSNRRSALFHIDLKGNCELLSADSGSVSSPRLSPDHRWLVYLQGRVFGPHHQCLLMMLYDIEKRSSSVLIDVIRRAGKGQFAGVYDPLPPQCWASNSEEIFFSSPCGNSKVVFSVDRQTGRIRPVYDTKREFGSARLLTVINDLLVISCSSPNHPPSLVVGFVSSRENKQEVQWTHLGGADVCEKFDWQDIIITPPPEEENHQFSGLTFGAVLLKPDSSSKSGKIPLVVFIHVNYRGSTGFGQDSIDSLLGNVGSQDVKDVQRAVLHILQSDQALDADRVAVMGGSHGGFLACHLIGQYPEFYRACAARNPVINAATLVGTSDIVDWRYSSVGLHYSFDQLPTPEALITMLEKSPIAHAAQICAPVLLMLGGKDKRVSPYQGLELYKALKSRKSPVRLLWYDGDGHSLSRLETQSDCFLNIALWFQQHLNMN